MLMHKTTRINPTDLDLGRHTPDVKRPDRAGNISGKFPSRVVGTELVGVAWPCTPS